MNNVKRLPDAYYKGTDGNNYKLLYLNELAATDLLHDITAALNCLDIYQATGKTLDLYGEMLGQHRGALDDAQYKLLILNKVGKNICQGDYNSVVELLAKMFKCSKDEIIITDSDSTLKVTLAKFPLEILLNAGFSGAQAVTIIEMLLPVCVKLTDINFQGTFEFGSDVVTYRMLENRTYTQLESLSYEELECSDYDEDKGFSNSYVYYTNTQIKGGYLGLSVESNTFDLPI